MPPSQSIMWQIISIYYPRWVNLRGCFEADICESSRIVRLLSGRIWSDLRCVVSPCQRCGTGCSSGVSSPRSSSTGPWGCSCWSCCSATRGAASSPWCWSAWVSWPPSPGASSPVSPVTSVFLLLFFVPSISSVFRPTWAAFSGAGRWREVTGRKRRRVRWREIVRRLLSNRGRQESTETEREREVLDTFVFFCFVYGAQRASTLGLDLNLDTFWEAKMLFSPPQIRGFPGFLCFTSANTEYSLVLDGLNKTFKDITLDFETLGSTSYRPNHQSTNLGYNQ